MTRAHPGHTRKIIQAYPTLKVRLHKIHGPRKLGYRHTLTLKRRVILLIRLKEMDDFRDDCLTEGWTRKAPSLNICPEHLEQMIDLRSLDGSQPAGPVAHGFAQNALDQVLVENQITAGIDAEPTTIDVIAWQKYPRLILYVPEGLVTATKAHHSV
ncbi:hypothetical protein ACIQW5_29080 [Methylorubrum thiocyanatum]|uniref:hypothetical protein n=1 Tax=Methylorubrum thiocyanatum TaxID=47958 RepID=UPI00383B1644